MTTTKAKSSDLKQKICYIFQGGGALGSYQMGAYEALKDSGYSPDMIVGISIGSINASIIAGNKPENRKDKLRAFWDKVTTETSFPFNYFGMPKIPNWIGAQSALVNGQPGFFKPKLTPPTNFLKHTPDELGYYDTSPLRETLSELIDFDYLNQGDVRLCLGSVELGSGEFTFFDNHEQVISVDHIMASGALPPAFPPIKIDGKYYIDGGIFSNSPVFKVIDEFVQHPEDRRRILCFMVDVF
jgi:NTE family protein